MITPANQIKPVRQANLERPSNFQNHFRAGIVRGFVFACAVHLAAGTEPTTTVPFVSLSGLLETVDAFGNGDRLLMATGKGLSEAMGIYLGIFMTNVAMQQL